MQIPALSLLLLSVFLDGVSLVGCTPISARRDIHAGATGIAFLIAVMIICCLFSLLLLAKWMFICLRRNPNSRRRYEPWPYCLRAKFRFRLKDSTTHSHPHHSLLGPSESKFAKRSKSAFLIGLFGSPSWETRYSAVIHEGPVLSRDSDSYYFRSSFHGFGSAGFHPMDSTRRKMGQQWYSRSQTPTRTPSFSFMDLGPEDLAFKSTIHISSPLARSSRIFSVKRRRYLSNDTGLHSGSVFFPGRNKSHPFVELANLQSKSLDSYPEANIYAPEPAFIPLGDKRHTFPVYDVLGIRQSNLTGSSGTEVWGRGSVVQTSDLQSPPLIISQEEEQVSSGLFNSSNFAAAIDEPTRFSASTVGSQLPEETVQDVSATNIPLSPPAYKDSQSNIIPFRERVTPLKPRKRHEHVQPPPSTQQSRATLRSAKHGPSPLRSMFIPAEEQSTNIIGFSLGDSLNEQPSNILSTNHEVSELASCILEKKPLSEAKSSEDSLTNLLKELLDETSAWDESLFVDENFKALIGGEGTSKDQIRQNNDSLTEPSDKSRQGGGQDHDLEEILEVEDVDFDIGNFRLYDQDNSFWYEEVFQDPSCIIGLAR